MDLCWVVREACQECDGKADIDACYNIDINDSADDTAIQETSIYFMFVESGSIAGICIRIVIEK